MSNSPFSESIQLSALVAKFPWAGQLIRFGSVGGLATMVHVGAYVGLVEKADLNALTANVLAFAIAVVVSFVGHAGWTFRQEFRQSRRSVQLLFFRFTISALLGLLLNTLFVFLLVTLAQLPYGWAIPFFVFVTPLVVYLANRLWVFA